MEDRAHAKIRSREELLAALTTAAELEHNLCCMYLFAAFSMKKELGQFEPDWEQDDEARARAEVRREQVRDWKTTILAVARQEMEHLGFVCNLLNAVGGAQHFTRPNFPQRASYYAGFANRKNGLAMTLERFDLHTMQRFVQVEMPANLDPHDGDRYTPHDPAVFTEPDQLVEQPFDFTVDLVQTLYTSIREGMEWLDAHGPGPLFIGPPSAQVDDASINVGFGNEEFGISLFQVTDLATACHAVDRIIEQGEGVVLDGKGGEIAPDSHYERFVRVRNEVAAIDWDPALDVARNPALNLHPDNQVNASLVTIVTDPDTRAVMEVFDAGYQIMVFMLIRFFGGGDDTANDRQALLRTAFFPFMTLVIRPLGEILCEMPAFEGDPDGRRAGPGFEYSSDLAFLPNRHAGWEYLAERLDDLAAGAERVRDKWAGLDYVSDSIKRLATNFRRDIFGTTPPVDPYGAPPTYSPTP